jgi:hypothetical protein
VVPFLIEYDANLAKHLNMEQFWHDGSNDYLRIRCIVKFQFVWYENVNHSGHEVGRLSGGLYRDDTGQKLQLQSFLVSDLIAQNTHQ